MFWIRHLNASKASARQKYVLGPGESPKGTKFITPEAFEALLGADPTPSKKYIEDICRWVFELVMNRRISYQYFNLKQFPQYHMKNVLYLWEESESAVSGEFIFNTGSRLEVIPYTFIPWAMGLCLNYDEALKKYGNRGWFPKNLKEFDYLTDLQEFLRKGIFEYLARESVDKNYLAVKKLISQYSGKNEFEVVKDDDRCLLIGVVSYEFSFALGRVMTPRAPWCVQRSLGDWFEYIEEIDDERPGSCFYYLLDKTTGDQYYIESPKPLFGRQVAPFKSFVFWTVTGDDLGTVKEARNVLIRCGINYEKDLFYFEPCGADYEDEGYEDDWGEE